MNSKSLRKEISEKDFRKKLCDYLESLEDKIKELEKVIYR